MANEEIDATDGTNVDGGGNEGINFPTVTNEKPTRAQKGNASRGKRVSVSVSV